MPVTGVADTRNRARAFGRRASPARARSTRPRVVLRQLGHALALLGCLAQPSGAQTALPPADWALVETEIHTDGRFGGSPSEIERVGQLFTIEEPLGLRVGDELFYGFDVFNLGSGDTARFTAEQRTDNVVSYVSGGASYINGEIDADSVPGADFYFLNPNGVFFGPEATVDVPGAFHLSADATGAFANGMQLTLSGDGASPSFLAVAELPKFGFLGGPIEFQGTVLQTFSRPLSAPRITGELSVRGGDITLSGGAGIFSTGQSLTLQAGDQILLHGLDGAGTGSLLQVTNTLTSGSGTAAIRLQAGRVELGEGAVIASYSNQAACEDGACGGTIDIAARDEILLHGSSKAEGSGTDGLKTTFLIVFGDASIADDFSTLTLSKGSPAIVSFTQSQAAGTGQIRLAASSIRVLEGAEIESFVGADSASQGVGTITLEATESVEISGTGGDGAGSLVASRNSANFDGVAGDITVETGALVVRDGGRLASSVDGTQRAGTIEVTALAGIRIEGHDATAEQAPSAIEAVQRNPAGTGRGGDVVLATSVLSLGDGARIRASSQSRNEGAGAGSIRIEADAVRLAGGSEISVFAQQGAVPPGGLPPAGEPSQGLADGNIAIAARDLLSLDGASRIEASVESGLGGSITIGGEVEQVAGTPAGAGPVFEATAPAQGIVLREGSAILAQANGADTADPAKVASAPGAPTARGGDIEINALSVLVCPDCEINADGPTASSAGSVVINSPETAIESQVVPPQVSYLDASSLLQAQCGSESVDSQAAGGQFTVARWPGLPLSPEGPLLAFSPLGEGLEESLGGGLGLGETVLAQQETASVAPAPGSSVPVYEVYQLAMRSGGDAMRGGRTQQAASAFGRASEAAAANGDAEARGDALRGLGQARQASGAYRESLVPLEEALALARAATDPAREAAALGALGNAYVALGQQGPAEQLLREAVDVARGGSAGAEQHAGAVSPALRAGLLNNLGNQQALSGNASGALVAYHESAQEARAAGEWLRGAHAEANAARTALGLGQREQTRSALARAREALAQADATAAEQTAVRIHLASSEAVLARQDPAARRKALLAAHGDLLRASQAAQAQGDDRTASHALGKLGALYAQEGSRDREARYLTRRAVALAEQAQAADLLARWYAQLGKLAWQEGEVDDALDAYRRAVSLLGETRPEASAAYSGADLAFRQAVEPVYLALVDLLLRASTQAATPGLEQRRLAEARQVVEQWKAAELRNYFRDSCAAELQATARSLETVDPGAAVVYPIVLADRVELLVSRASGIARFPVAVPAPQLEEEVRRLRRLLAKRTTREYQAPAQQLYQWLVAPYASLLEAENIDTLVFVPGGALRTIPLAALHDGERFLLERYAVAITPSLDLLAPRPLDPGASQLLLAGVSEAVQGYPELPSVEGELAAIEALYGGEVLLNASFDAEGLASALRNQRPGIVHLASHAEFTGDPDSSFVLTHDDRLSMEELTSLVRTARYGDEPVELLMLSACETAVGDERAALGLAGVAIRAGARSAMGSLWSVSDEATSQLVVGFYEALDDAGMSKAGALRQAQQQLMAEARFRHPYYWAPFLVINNWL